MEKLNSEFWQQRYRNDEIGWNIGYVSTPLKTYFDQLTDKRIKILIPGAGNAYEAEYLHELGFENVFVLDWADLALENLKKRTPEFPSDHLICGDFFAHDGAYDLIIEQTFFCALDPSLRTAYLKKMHRLLKPEGKLTGLLFNAPLNDDKPPFGGSLNEYRPLFSRVFELMVMEKAINSIEPRFDNEVFFIAKKTK